MIAIGVILILSVPPAARTVMKRTLDHAKQTAKSKGKHRCLRRIAVTTITETHFRVKPGAAVLFLNKLSGKLFGTKTRLLEFRWGADGEMNMKKLLISAVAAALVVSFAVSAEAAGNKQKVSAEVQASCKAQAAKKFSAIHFLKRRNFVNTCIAQHANAKMDAKAKPTSAGQTVKPTTTGQAPKQAQ
jgi:hypothetical protein